MACPICHVATPDYRSIVIKGISLSGILSHAGKYLANIHKSLEGNE
jgi:hypothetical protein